MVRVKSYELRDGTNKVSELNSQYKMKKKTKKYLHFVKFYIMILCKAKKEKSRYMEVFRECPAGARAWQIYIEYVPEPLPEISVGIDGSARYRAKV